MVLAQEGMCRIRLERVKCSEYLHKLEGNGETYSLRIIEDLSHKKTVRDDALARGYPRELTSYWSWLSMTSPEAVESPLVAVCRIGFKKGCAIPC
jgi:hypothetical protein